MVLARLTAYYAEICKINAVIVRHRKTGRYTAVCGKYTVYAVIYNTTLFIET